MPGQDEQVLVQARARLGTVLRGKYRLDRVLGSGGMASVFAATHRNGKEFAVKLLHAGLSTQGDMRGRFLREGYVANSVKHPGAVSVIDDDLTEDGSAFIVMELLDGDTVEHLWERAQRQLPLVVVAGVGIQLLDVLAAAHSRGVIHRDIKPANLFLTRTGQLKVLDFGIARLRDLAVSQATLSGMMLGTPAFMAPEQAAGKTTEIDARTDLWSVGATLFTLASGQLVHPATSQHELIIMAAMSRARSLDAVLPGAPALVREIIDRALAWDRNDRWASAVAMREALKNAAAADLGGVPSQQLLADAVEALLRGDAQPTEHLASPPVLLPGFTPPGLGPSSPAPSPPVHLRDPGPPPTPRVISVIPPQPQPQALAPVVPGPEGVTAQPVSRDPSVGRPVGGQRPPPIQAIVAVAVVLGMGTLLLVVLLVARHAHHESAQPAQPAQPPPPVATIPPTATTPTETATEPPPPAPDVPTATETAGSTEPPPPATATATATGTATATATATTTATAPPPRKKSCNPPYEIDAQGVKRWKRECL